MRRIANTLASGARQEKGDAGIAEFIRKGGELGKCRKEGGITRARNGAGGHGAAHVLRGERHHVQAIG